MENEAHVLFHQGLNVFLPKNQRQKWIKYSYTGAPAVKDALEALGVPHPEIGRIDINGREVGFSAPLTSQDRVEVFPVVPEASTQFLPSLQKPINKPALFILDVHLGKLARYLRLLGFDSLYETHYDDGTIALLAAQQQRIVLTRDVGLLKHKLVEWGYWLRSQDWEMQLQEVLIRFGLVTQLRPFTRCMTCNGLINEVPKQEVIDLLPPKTKQYFEVFYQCQDCLKVYWKGSHYEKMEQFLKNLQEESKA